MKGHGPKASARGFFRDPLLHFALIGVVLFAAFMLLNNQENTREGITVSTAQQEQLVAAFTRVWRRPPSADELKGLLDDWVREEIANREAMTMGLASNDLVIRRRLRQKYESFMDQIAASIEPEDKALQAWYEAHAKDYRQDARFSLRQRFFSSDRREDPKADAELALSAIDTANPQTDPELGDALAMPQRFDNNRETQLSNRFGPLFSKALKDLPIERWSGPVPSAYGYHLVYIERVEKEAQPNLEDVKTAVLRDWRAQQLEDARESLYAKLLERYEVTIQAASTPPAR